MHLPVLFTGRHSYCTGFAKISPLVRLVSAGLVVKRYKRIIQHGRVVVATDKFFELGRWPGQGVWCVPWQHWSSASAVKRSDHFLLVIIQKWTLRAAVLHGVNLTGCSKDPGDHYNAARRSKQLVTPTLALHLQLLQQATRHATDILRMCMYRQGFPGHTCVLLPSTRDIHGE